MKDVLAVILAGGKGSRLEPLTRDRAKPAVPFGGQYRIVDFPLSNCINSGLRKIFVLTQYKAASLDRHINLGWRFLCRDLGEFIDILPPQQRIDETWYKGTADAIYQNIYSIEKELPKYVLILAGDHIYKMNYARMLAQHVARDADLTVGCIPVPLDEARQFGVMTIDAEQRVIQFAEKPANPAPMPGSSDRALGSMGIYVFNTQVLFEKLFEDATRSDSAHDFGRNIIPGMIGRQPVYAYMFEDENRKEQYWRDVGTLDAYYQSNMDLIQIDPILNLYDQEWPIRTYQPQFPPPKFVFNDHNRRGTAVDSMICQGCIISGGYVARSILAPNVRINSFAAVEDSILFEGVRVGRYAKIRRAIIDKDVQVPSGTEIGYNLDQGRERGLRVTEGGVVVIAKAEGVERFAASIPLHGAGERFTLRH